MRGLPAAPCVRHVGTLAQRDDRMLCPSHPPCSTPSMKFKGSDNYVATQDLMLAVNAAITLKRPLLVKGEPGTGKTMLAEEVAQAARPAAAAVAHQVDHQGPAGPLRIRRGEPAARFAAGRRAREGHPQLHRQGRAVAGLHCRRAGGAADRRDRQGRHRIPERPAARARPHGVLLLRDARAGPRQAPAGGLHHLEQREGTARRLPAPLLLPLHQVPRRRDDEEHRRRCTSPASSRSCWPRR